MRDEDVNWLAAHAEPRPLWFVVFLPRRADHWWNWLAFGHWKHVACLRFNAAVGLWQVYGFGLDGMEALHVTRREVVHLVEMWKGEGASILQIEQGDSIRPERNLLMTCVGMVKALTRQGGGALRPSALYTNLRRCGAVPAWESHDAED